MADVVADTAAGFARLAEQGRPHFRLIAPLARYAVRRRNAGRRVGSSLRKNDVLSLVPRDAARVESLDTAAKAGGSWRESLPDSRDVDPAELAASRVYFERWLAGLPDRHRRVVLALAEGDKPTELGRLPGRDGRARPAARGGVI